MTAISTLHSVCSTFPSTRGKPFEFEIKFHARLEKYQEAFDQLENVFSAVQASPSPEGVNTLSEHLQAMKVFRSKLDQKGLFSKPIVEVLNQQDVVLKQIELFAGQFFADSSLDCQFNSIEEAISKAKTLENGIDLEELTKDERRGRELFRKYCTDLKAIIGSYHYVLNAGREDVQHDYEQAISNFDTFKKFEKRFVDRPGYEFRYCIHAIVGNNVLYPLQYHDPRLQNALEILTGAQDIGGIPEKCQNLVFKLLCLPPESHVQQLLMQVAKETVCSVSFQNGKDDWDEEDLHDYREEKFRFLDQLIDIAKNKMQWVGIMNVPQKLKISIKMLTHPRVYLLRAAHRLGVRLDDRVEWKIDAWMAELRYQLLSGYGPDNDHRIYLSRRHQKSFGLLLNSKEDPYHPEHVKDKYRNVTENYMPYLLFQKPYENLPTEDELIDHVLVRANQSFDFKSLLLVDRESYFEENNPERLSREGAKALLFTTGYLSP